YTVACLTRGGRGIEEGAVAPELASRMVAIPCDVTDDKSIVLALAKAAQQPGGLRGLINSAGLHGTAPSAQLGATELRTMLEINTIGLFVTCREAYPHFKARGDGMIVNLGSFFDRMGVPRNLAYAASKAAVGAVTRCLAVEWAKDHITVINVAPGYIETDLNREFLSKPSVQNYLIPRIPMGRTGKPDEIARFVAALFDEDMAFMTGETVYIDGAQTIAH
ncbi:MAG TPA: SDR family oxidoreductase, partial [bacterium]